MSWDSVPASAAVALYPPVAAHDAGFLDVGDGHRIYWEVGGNPLGRPALYLHGGPGGAATADARRFFDAARYRIVLFDQRGCGRSEPRDRLEANTTAHLIGDIEKLREALAIDRWLVFGGSWGATLALAYAQRYPTRVAALVLRAVFLGRQRELDWLYALGASQRFPDAWERFVAPIPARERDDFVGAYHRRVASADPAVALPAARAWCAWEDALIAGGQRPAATTDADDAALLTLARIETHYFVHRAFIEEGELLAGVHRLAGIPGVVVQGSADAVTPPAAAWELCRAWLGATLVVVPCEGHSSSEPGIQRSLVAATDRFCGADVGVHRAYGRDLDTGAGSHYRRRKK
ncbi:prolyl aminopeptidase [Aromatoleum evansii]|uniref:Proline iminopeptidase n=1 Tax=Aromatoleum evansii TaxID=59406 RepID=A0ABZ1AS95_AROEV|nr:prolyl aminopeptidase [Aromatoleum evansii]